MEGMWTDAGVDVWRSGCSIGAGGFLRVSQESLFDFSLIELQSSDRRRRLI